MDVVTHGGGKYRDSELLASSAGLRWSSLTAELRAHGVSETLAVVTRHVEICLVLEGNSAGNVRRTGAGQKQERVPLSGTIWLSPIGVDDHAVAITAPVPQTLHLYLPTSTFQRLSEEFNLPDNLARSLQYAAGIRDDLIEQIGRSIASELRAESSASRVFADTAAFTLAASLMKGYRDIGERTLSDSSGSSARGLDPARLRRVIAYIVENAFEDISLEALATVSGYSVFHFARKFALATGVSPGRYISQMRLRNAKAELETGRLSLAEIALNARFSSQASFTRAFHRATGTTPKVYQRRH